MTAAFEVLCDSNDRDAWLAERRNGIGGSDAPAILGLVPWASPSSVQVDKWGLSEDADTPEHMRWGQRLEGAILEGLGDELREHDPNTRVDRFGKLICSTAMPIMRCTPDGLVPASQTFVQAKNTMKAEDWRDAAPKYVWVQCQHEMFVTGRDEEIAVALIFGNRLRWQRIARDHRWIDGVWLPAAEDFWKHVENHDPVPTDGSDATKRALAQLYPEDSGETIVLDGSFLEDDERLQALKSEEKTLRSRIQEIEHRLKGAIADATYGQLPNGVEYSLKTTRRAAYTVKPSSYRTLRRKESKR